MTNITKCWQRYTAITRKYDGTPDLQELEEIKKIEYYVHIYNI